MLDLRYHVYSLAAVFLALAIGIVIGASFARSAPSSSTGRKIIQRYETDAAQLRTAILETRREASRQEDLADSYEEFCRAVMPIVLRDKLMWRSVAIVQTGDYPELTGSVKQVLELAGAQVSNVTVMSGDFPFDDNARIAQVLADAGVMPENTGNRDRDRLFSIIAQCLRSGEHRDKLSKVEAAGVASFSGDYARHNRMVVMVGGSTSDARNTAATLDAHLVAQFEAQDMRPVGCEPEDAQSSYIPDWHKVGMATVDNADSPVGQVAMVYALNGETGMFGVKEGAEKLIPQTLETE